MFTVIATQTAFIPETQRGSEAAFTYLYFNSDWGKFSNFYVSPGRVVLPSGTGLNIGVACVFCRQWVQFIWQDLPGKLSTSCKSASVFIFNIDEFK